ncbi:IclR family transcriptional regulator [Acidiphilium sp. AL]|uniref:IclR family transcriptional regulator n=1 Tax=Acidiphilium iwatense TaxID=768198 RepID=A0ABS9E0C4_9PROT|nr:MULTISPECIES: IclR family transcriptional regulator [Acidiphilium]MCF3948388.1 IclR family transcriptional regulator [Acidiphilium iwatense]MCU4161865.1 IclR family transcriptional regulator [Acidiphilium sp. AL]
MDTPITDLPSSIAKALALLRCVSTAEPHANFSTLLDRTGLPKATLHRLLQELIEAGLIRSGPDRTYRPSLGLLELAYRAWESIDLKQVAARHVDALWHSTEETVHLAVRDGLEIIYIDKRESPKTLRLFSSIGRRGPLHCTGVGKAILAHLPEAEREDVIARITLTGHTPHTITSRHLLRAEFDRIRSEGIARDCEEHEEGIFCVAAPIFDRNFRPVASLSVTAPGIRMDRARLDALAPEVKQAARLISQDVVLSNCSV